MLLALDTATRNASIALYNAEGILAEASWRSRENHTVELMAQIARLLDLERVPKSDLKAIGVATGPGSFTGLRVGMSVAKGMAWGLHIPLIGIPTLDAVAYAFAFQPALIWAMVAAGRGRFAAASYKAQGASVHRTSDYVLVDAIGLADLITREDERALVCGEVDAAVENALKERVGARVVIAPPALSLRRAGLLAELAWARFSRGEADDPYALAPLYMSHKT